MYIVLGGFSIFGLLAILWLIRKENSKLKLQESKKQKRVSFILNPKKNSEIKYHTNVLFDEENQDDIIDRLKNAYIHPWEKTFHAPVFKRRNRRSSVRFLFDFETAAETMKKSRSEGDGEEHKTAFSSNQDREESKSATGDEEHHKLLPSLPSNN